MSTAVTYSHSHRRLQRATVAAKLNALTSTQRNDRTSRGEGLKILVSMIALSTTTALLNVIH